MKKSIQENIETASSRQTQTVAQQFARRIFTEPSERSHALVVALAGELGSGKTTFVQGFVRGLGIREKVLSPTFVIMRSYNTSNTPYAIRTLWHIDCYRLQTPEELKELGWDTIVSDPHNIVLVEWPERIKHLFPPHAITVLFESTGEHKRKIFVERYLRKKQKSTAM